ncbi:MAG: Phytochrome-like protein cph2 [Stenotrophomonas maltophilia]|nr:MAG: Phytochrome-like protein cph2 [Stenotrophomonas maltophilia]
MREAVDGSTEVYRALLESTQAIPWRIDWTSMRFTYIGPQIEPLLGWSQASWVSVEDWASRMHPEDRDAVVAFCVSQSQAGTDHEADYRALTASGGYVWIRDVVHVTRNAAGEVEALVGFMFDISERKRAEQQLIELQRQLEAYSYQDGLTGAANRRRIDATLATEWASAQRELRPLSLVLLDIDFFKQYNDHYGHLQGDECLRSVAHLLSDAVRRPRDLVGRYGGEEFLLLLPDTDAEAARQVAERCRQVLREAGIAHARSGVAEHLTVSLGVGTVQPRPGQHPKEFLSAVDRLLYRAKRAGRDQAHCDVWDGGAEPHTHAQPVES